MGSGPSKPTEPVASTSAGQLSEKGASQLAANLAKYLTLDEAEMSYQDTPLTPHVLTQWSEKLLNDPKNRLALSAVSNGDVGSIVRQRGASVKDKVHVFSDKVEVEGSPVTNQRSSGRCWIFASTNIFRVQVQKKYNLEDFQLSQAYLFFYDKLEKSNYFLQTILDTLDEDLDSRLVQTILKDPASDGGQWDMIVNLVEKYGLVPQSLYPDSFNASSSSKLNYVVVSKLREFALLLREAAADASTSRATLIALKESFVRTIHNILVIALGPPPSPDATFNWEFADKDGKYHSVTSTPKDFYKSAVGFKATKYFSLLNDPRNPYKTLYTVNKLGNIVDGKPIEYVNADISVLKNAAIKAIQNNEPVFFGSDVSHFADRDDGILDDQAWDYSLAFNTELGMTKKQRVLSNTSAMNHAMVLTAVNLEGGRPTRWRVENSWGSDVGEKGFFIMSDSWFDEFVFQVVTNAKYTDKEYVDIWKKKDYKVLPRWDPMGSLA